MIVEVKGLDGEHRLEAAGLGQVGPHDGGVEEVEADEGGRMVVEPAGLDEDAELAGDALDVAREDEARAHDELVGEGVEGGAAQERAGRVHLELGLEVGELEVGDEGAGRDGQVVAERGVQAGQEERGLGELERGDDGRDRVRADGARRTGPR